MYGWRFLTLWTCFHRASRARLLKHLQELMLLPSGLLFIEIQRGASFIVLRARQPCHRLVLPRLSTTDISDVRRLMCYVAKLWSAYGICDSQKMLWCDVFILNNCPRGPISPSAGSLAHFLNVRPLVRLRTSWLMPVEGRGTCLQSLCSVGLRAL